MLTLISQRIGAVKQHQCRQSDTRPNEGKYAEGGQGLPVLCQNTQHV